MKGKTVVQHLANDQRFSEEFDLRVIVDGEGDAVEVLNELDIPWDMVNTPKNPVEAIEQIAPESSIEYLVTCGWVCIIPKEVLQIPTVAALNCHSSYLPYYKGLSVYRPQWAHAEQYGGATIHLMTEELDQGAIVTQGRFSISLWDTPIDIANEYSDLTAPLLREAIELLEQGYEGREHSGGQYYSKLPWSTTILYGFLNHIFRALGLSYRKKISPTKGEKPGFDH